MALCRLGGGARVGGIAGFLGKTGHRSGRQARQVLHTKPVIAGSPTTSTAFSPVSPRGYMVEAV